MDSLHAAMAFWQTSMDIERFRELAGREPTSAELAKGAAIQAAKHTKAVEADIEAALARLAVLELELDRARASELERQAEYDAADLAEVTAAAPPLSEIDRLTVDLNLDTRAAQ